MHPASDRNQRFRNADGVYMKMMNLASLHPDRREHKGLRTSAMDRRVWSDYWTQPGVVAELARGIALGAQLLAPEPAEQEALEGYEAPEGRILYRIHKLRERRRGFRSRVLTRVQRRWGDLRCEACGVRLPTEARTDPVAISIFEVHHLVAIARVAEAPTKLDDLVLLCASCHRLIHALMRSQRTHVNLQEFNAWLMERNPLVSGRRDCR